jgi:hypothetical protein
MDPNEMSLSVLKAEADVLRGEGVWPGFRWPDEFKNKVRALHKEGVSAGDIAAHTRITIDLVKAWTYTNKPQKKEKKFLQVPVKKIEIKNVSIALEGGKRIEGLELEDIRDLLLSGAL